MNLKRLAADWTRRKLKTQIYWQIIQTQLFEKKSKWCRLRKRSLKKFSKLKRLFCRRQITKVILSKMWKKISRKLIYCLRFRCRCNHIKIFSRHIPNLSFRPEQKVDWDTAKHQIAPWNTCSVTTAAMQASQSQNQPPAATTIAKPTTKVGRSARKRKP